MIKTIKLLFTLCNAADLDADEELVYEWLIKSGDEVIAHVIDRSDSSTIRLESYVELPMNAETPLCIARAGNIHTGKLDKINLEEINEWIRGVKR